MKESFKRRKYPLVNRSHQYRFLALIILYNLLIVCFIVMAFLIPDIMQMLNESLPLEIRAAAADKILFFHARLLLAIFGLICVIGLHSFRVFHRFVGPLHRLTLAFGQMGGGDLSFRIKFRDDDYLHDEAKIFNEMMDRLGSKISDIQGACQAMDESVGRLERAGQKESGSGVSEKEALSLVRGRLEILKAEMGFFRSPKPVPSDHPEEK
jgi:methyl-accepting chemotaxis protein